MGALGLRDGERGFAMLIPTGPATEFGVKGLGLSGVPGFE